MAVALLHADTLSEAIIEAGRNVPRDEREISAAVLAELLTMSAGPTGKWFTFIQVYFASIQILIETVERTGIATKEMVALLSDMEMRLLLLDFRDNLLHGGSLSTRESKRFYENLLAVSDWAHQLRETTANYMIRVFNREENRVALERWLYARDKTR